MKNYFESFQNQEQAILEDVLSLDFIFSSPHDNN